MLAIAEYSVALARKPCRPIAVKYRLANGVNAGITFVPANGTNYAPGPLGAAHPNQGIPFVGPGLNVPLDGMPAGTHNFKVYAFTDGGGGRVYSAAGSPQTGALP